MTSMPLRRLPTIILAMTPFLVLGLLTAAFALQARSQAEPGRVVVERVLPL